MRVVMLAPAGVYLLGAVIALLLPRDRGRLAHLIALVGSVIGAGVAVKALLDGTIANLDGYAVAPYARMAFRLDPLAAFFLLVISLVAIPVSLYALGYLRDEPGTHAGLAAAYALFLASMGLVVLADSLFAFLLAWELMSLVSFFLVMHHHQQADVRRAGYIYLVMTHIGTAFLLVGFLLLAAHAGGSMDFAAFRAGAPGLSPWMRDGVFLLMLVGFGAKAGVIPLHIWLPRAHPAAPSYVSALMSGVMIKTAIYGIIRVGWDFAGPGPVWWGGIILGLGIVSAVFGVLYALLEHDIKRLLAYSSVENIGVIFIGIGTALMLTSLGHPGAAALALVAGLLHVFNHALFKSLLFLGAGAIQRGTRVRDLEELGGLIRPMPWTAATFLIGAASIAAILPLNGFVSEWLTFQGLLQLGVVAHGVILALCAAVAAGGLALTGGLAAFCFIRAFGVAFLGVPRSAHAAAATEVHLTMRAGMALLAVPCVIFGIFPMLMFRLLRPVTVMLAGAVAETHLRAVPALKHDPAQAQHGAYGPPAIFLLLLLAGGLVLVIARALGGPVRRRIAPPWVCGVRLEPAMQYTASALSKAIRIIFRTVVRPNRAVEITYSHAPYFVASVRYEGTLHPVYERYLYRPAVRVLLLATDRVRRLQNGRLRLYLGYQFAVLIIVLLLTR